MKRVRRTLLTFAVLTAVLMIAAPVSANRCSLGGEIYEILADGEKIIDFKAFNYHTT